MFEFYMAERLRHRWVRLRLYRFPGSVLTDYRILKNYAKTPVSYTHLTHLVWYLFALCQRIIEVKEPANLFRLAASVLLLSLIHI